MTVSRTLLTAIASLAVAMSAPLLAQEPQTSNAAAQGPQPTGSSNCPMAGQGMHGSSMGRTSQGMMGGQQMTQMMQQMQQMHTEMQAMHKEMLQMHQEMRKRR